MVVANHYQRKKISIMSQSAGKHLNPTGCKSSLLQRRQGTQGQDGSSTTGWMWAGETSNLNECLRYSLYSSAMMTSRRLINPYHGYLLAGL